MIARCMPYYEFHSYVDKIVVWHKYWTSQYLIFFSPWLHKLISECRNKFKRQNIFVCHGFNVKKGFSYLCVHVLVFLPVEWNMSGNTYFQSYRELCILFVDNLHSDYGFDSCRIRKCVFAHSAEGDRLNNPIGEIMTDMRSNNISCARQRFPVDVNVT